MTARDFWIQILELITGNSATTPETMIRNLAITIQDDVLKNNPSTRHENTVVG